MVLKSTLGQFAMQIRKSRYARKPPCPKRILVFSFHGIGDAILQTPKISLIRKIYPGSHITLAATENVIEAFSNNPHINECLTYKHGGFQGVSLAECLTTLQLVLFKRNYDLALLDSSSGKLRGNLLAVLLGARYIVSDGIAAPENNFLADEIVTYDERLHQAERNAAILNNSVSGYYPPNFADIELSVLISGQEQHRAEIFFKSREIDPDRKVIILHPGSGNRLGIHKRWPIKKYLELLDRLKERFPGYSVLVIKGPHEDEINYKYFAEKECVIIENFTLLEVAAIIRRASVFVGNDSGIAHLAASQNIPIVSIFGPTDEKLIRPYGKQVYVVRRQMECAPCWGGPGYLQACNKKIGCLADLEATAVLGAVQACLAGADDGGQPEAGANHSRGFGYTLVEENPGLPEGYSSRYIPGNINLNPAAGS